MNKEIINKIKELSTLLQLEIKTIYDFKLEPETVLTGAADALDNLLSSHNETV